MRRLFLSLCALFGLTVAASAQCATGYTQLSNVFACQQNAGGAPVITSAATASGTVGTPFSYQIMATNTPTSFSATGLPSPLTVNTSTGLISGTPTATSSGTVVLGATNGTGTGNQNLALTIGAAGSNPITAANLTNGTNNSGGVVSATTASISPPANQLVIVSVGSLDGPSSTVPTVTGAGGTWTQIGTAVEAGANHRRVTLFRDLSATPGTGALTIDFAGHAQNNVAWSVNAFNNVNTTGTHGSGAIVQNKGMSTAQATTTGFTITLDTALASTRNAVYGVVRNSGGVAIVSDSTHTQLSNQLLNPGNGVPFADEWGINPPPPSWTWASQSVVTVAMALEIAAQ